MIKTSQNKAAALALGALLATSIGAVTSAQDGDETRTLEEAAAQVVADARAAEAELEALREANTALVLPLRQQLTELQKELVIANEAADAARGERNAGALKLSNLTKEIDTRRQTTTRLTSLFGEYSRNFESRLHVAEQQRYFDPIRAARQAAEDRSLTDSESFAGQAELLTLSMGRIKSILGGAKFAGRAIGEDGLVREGQFIVVGPTGIFRDDAGGEGGIGTAERVVGRSDPIITPFADPLEIEAAGKLIESGAGFLPFDGTNGKAHKIASTNDTLLEHIKKGGAIMYPILGMAGLALLVALYKWLTLLFVRRPSKKRLKGLLSAVADGDEELAKRRVKDIKGPAGRMLEAGVDTMRRSRDLMEEVMFEKVLIAKHKINKALPFIAICAASAPLLGLLGTVTGIINTFKQITVFGSGDVKSLSGGISEALITTKFGLIVAIPSLLLHAYLSRKARGVITSMETSAVQFANEVGKSDEFGEASEARRSHAGGVVTPEHELVRGQVSEILTDLLGPLSNDGSTSMVAGDEGNVALQS